MDQREDYLSHQHAFLQKMVHHEASYEGYNGDLQWHNLTLNLQTNEYECRVYH